MAETQKKVLLHITDLKQYFPVKKEGVFSREHLFVRANDGISIDIYEGETFGLVGESGCGKSTFGRTILQLYPQTGGRTIYYGRAIESLSPRYVEKIFKHLPAQKKECEELRKRAEELKKKFESYKEESIEQHQALENYNQANREFTNKLLDITSLIGGLYTASNLEEISKVYMEEYRAASKVCRNKEKIEQLEAVASIKGNQSDSVRQKIAKLNQEADEQQKIVDEKAGKIREYKKQNQKNPDFDLYESYMDSGINLADLDVKEIRTLRRDLQLIFQDPYSSLNPRMTVGQIIGEGLIAHGLFKKGDPKMQEYILQIMEQCGLAPYFIHRYPHQFSGGQRQRIGIARSLALRPKFVVCDEAVSALDVSIQSQVVNLLLDLKEKEHLTYLFISHDLSVVKYISDRIGVMYLGVIVELASTEALFQHSYHPYTEALLEAIPTTDLKEEGEERSFILEGDIPSPIHPPKGCKFHTRCRYCTDICRNVTPELREVEPGHFVACHHAL